jgi:hypothetical protein
MKSTVLVRMRARLQPARAWLAPPLAQERQWLSAIGLGHMAE